MRNRFLISVLLQMAVFNVAVADQQQSLNSLTFSWSVTTGFAPFQGLKDPAAASKLWMPLNDKTHGLETFSDWYDRISSLQGGLLESPFVAYAEQSRPGPWVREGARDDWQTPDSRDGFSWISKADRCTGNCYRTEYVHPVVASITARLDEPPTDARCQWGLTSTGFSSPILSCAEALTISVPLSKADTGEAALPILCVRRDDGRKGCQPIKATQLVVVAFGDSYAAGEGNPDRPTKWKDQHLSAAGYGWFSEFEESALWTDVRCHRSFWSHQTFAAMRLASTHPHSVVTYLNYSCSGAAILDGVLIPQWSPPGDAAPCTDPSSREHANAWCRLSHSQLAMAVSDLCKSRGVAPALDDTPPRGQLQKKLKVLERAAHDVVEQIPGTSSEHLLDSYKYYLVNDHTLANVDGGSIYTKDHLDILACNEPDLLKPDVVLLSIGGNDIGFGPLVRWALIPKRGPEDSLGVAEKVLLDAFLRRPQVVCPAGDPPKYDQDGCARYDFPLVADLGPKLSKLLVPAMTQLLGVNPGQIVAATYPDPMYKYANAERDSVTLCSDPSDNLVHHENVWDALHGTTSRFGVRLGNWDFIDSYRMPFNLTIADATTIESTTLKSLFNTQKQSSKENGYRLADKMVGAFRGHGWCAFGDPIHEQEPWLPSTANLEWGRESCSHNPSCWKAFVPRDRFVRTVNDSLLVESSKRPDELAGAMHPTAQGQAAMADAFAPLVEEVVGSASK